ncbi:MAG TPA: lysophospholipid acyltransferase family protein [Candidatus Sulfotelmatobacter sp.]|nr:lysophospholipid acyltransferase family protein [Candidatus Sulfotelmatobacter sp.]
MPEVSTREAAAAAQQESGPRRWTLRQRIVLSLIVWAGDWFIRLLGPTLRVSVSYEEGAQKTLDERPLVASFWHECMIPATYLFRNMGIRVMSSFSYDGEYMGRIIRRFGFVAVKGSSSRNPIRALLGLRRALEEGWTVAFTLDGPRGPRRQVKPGPAGLARSSGLAMTTFHAAVERAWVLHSWDRMRIPKPFSRVLVRVGRLIHVPPETTDEDLERYTEQLQSTLDRVCEFAEANVSKAGTSEFPYYSREQETKQQ